MLAIVNVVALEVDTLFNRAVRIPPCQSHSTNLKTKLIDMFFEPAEPLAPGVLRSGVLF
jgi:hypothetical protein